MRCLCGQNVGRRCRRDPLAFSAYTRRRMSPVPDQDTTALPVKSPSQT